LKILANKVANKVANKMREDNPGNRLRSGQSLFQVTLVVEDYDEAIDFYVNKLNFELLEDTYLPAEDKRWVLVAPQGGSGAAILLARASTPEQASCVGKQAGGRVFLFLATDDCWRDYNQYSATGVKFVRAPTQQDYGIVAVFEDLYGNLWDLLQRSGGHS
jgi:catechol 2,3-dioxygenase-like lactoylglutathione lyase family enzyme